MHSAVRPMAAAGVALVGAGLIAATPASTALTRAQIETEIQNVAVRLAANSIANIPANIVQTIANLPANELAGINATAKALNDSGNWWLFIPTNVVGFDQQDLEKVYGLSKMLLPITGVGESVAQQLSIVLAAEAPMTPNCTGIPGPCADPTYFDQYFRVPISTLLTGYTFPADLRNPIDPYDESWNGVDIQPGWAGQEVQLDPLGPAKALWNTLTQDPTGFEDVPTVADFAVALTGLAEAAFNGLNPFVPGTYCLPCQLVVPGAPDSLPKFLLFDKYYTIFNLGQQLTDENWIGGPQPVDEHGNPPWIDDVTVTNLWTKEAWEQIYHDAQAEGAPAVASSPDLPAAAKQNLTDTAKRVSILLHAVSGQLSVTGNVKGAEAVAASFASLVSQMLGSLQPAQQNSEKSLDGKADTPATLAITAKRTPRSPSSPGRADVEANTLSVAKSLFAGPKDTRPPARTLDMSKGLAGPSPSDTQKSAPGSTDKAKETHKPGPRAGQGSGRVTKPGGPVPDAARSVGDKIGKVAGKIANGLKRGKHFESDSSDSGSGAGNHTRGGSSD